VDPDEQAEEDGSNIDLDSQRKGKCAVVKTSTRQVASSDFRIFQVATTIIISFLIFTCAVE